MMLDCMQPFCKNPTTILVSTSFTFFNCFKTKPFEENKQFKYGESSTKLFRERRSKRRERKRRIIRVNGFLLPVDSWASNVVDSESLASQLFAVSILPYFGFLYFITKSNSAPKLTLFGFYFLLVFVGATIPAGIYAKVHYGTSLSNVDWLHDGTESLLILTNLFIVLGLRGAIRGGKHVKERSNHASGIEEADKSST